MALVWYALGLDIMVNPFDSITVENNASQRLGTVRGLQTVTIDGLHPFVTSRDTNRIINNKLQNKICFLGAII